MISRARGNRRNDKHSFFSALSADARIVVALSRPLLIRYWYLYAAL